MSDRTRAEAIAVKYERVSGQVITLTLVRAHVIGWYPVGERTRVIISGYPGSKVDIETPEPEFALRYFREWDD